MGQGQPKAKLVKPGELEYLIRAAPRHRRRRRDFRNESTRGATGWCLEVHDLAMAKYLAGREKDLRFLREAVRQGLLQKATLLERLAGAPTPKPSASG